MPTFKVHEDIWVSHKRSIALSKYAFMAFIPAVILLIIIWDWLLPFQTVLGEMLFTVFLPALIVYLFYLKVINFKCPGCSKRYYGPYSKIGLKLRNNCFHCGLEKFGAKV